MSLHCHQVKHYVACACAKIKYGDEWEEFEEMKEARAVHGISTVLVNDILDHC